MKKVVLITSLALTVLLSCQKEDDPVLEKDSCLKTIVAISDNGSSGETRTSLGDNGVSTLWSIDDEITVFYGNTDDGFNDCSFKCFNVSEDGLEAKFSTEDAVSGDMYFAMYPNKGRMQGPGYKGEFKLTKKLNLQTYLNPVQHATENSFDSDAGLGVASGTVEDGVAVMRFKNIGALLGFKIVEDGINSITINSDSPLAGEVRVSAQTAEINDDINDDHTVCLEGEFINGKTYYAVVLPGEHTLTITYGRADGKSATVRAENSLSVLRNGNYLVLKNSMASYGKTYEEPEPGMLSFSLTDGTNTFNAFNIRDGYIDIQVPEKTDLANMTANFTFIGEKVTVDNLEQISGVESHDFSDFVNPIQYVVETQTDQDKEYTIRLFNLPIIFVKTEGSAEIVSKEEWLACSFVIRMTDGTVIDYGTTNIKGRGNTSWSLQDKKPYTIKLEKKQEVFGMPKHKRWQLLTTYGNAMSFFRDEMMFEIARRSASLGWAPHGHFADLFVNGEHRGLYWLCEKISVDKNRVNIAELKPEDTDPESVTGGYLFEFSAREEPQFYSQYFNFNYCFKDPDENIPAEQLNYITNFINNLEASLVDDARFARREYAEYLDIESWIDYWFMHEIAEGTDIKLPNYPGLSCFCYKDRGGKLKAGPVWDMHFWGKSGPDYHAKDALYYQRLFEDPVFVQRVKDKWYGTDTEKGFPELVGEIDSRVDSIALLINQSGDRDLKMWNKDETVSYQANNFKSQYRNNIKWMNFCVKDIDSEAK